MTFSILKIQPGWPALAIIQHFCLRSVSKALTPHKLVNVWLDSSLNCIQIGKLEVKIPIANMLSWPALFIILFNGVLPY